MSLHLRAALNDPHLHLILHLHANNSSTLLHPRRLLNFSSTDRCYYFAFRLFSYIFSLNCRECNLKKQSEIFDGYRHVYMQARGPPVEDSTTDKNVSTWFRFSAREAYSSFLSSHARLYLVLFGMNEWRGTHEITALLSVERRVPSAVGTPQESVRRMIKWREMRLDRMWCADTILVMLASSIPRISEWWVSRNFSAGIREFSK